MVFIALLCADFGGDYISPGDSICYVLHPT